MPDDVVARFRVDLSQLSSAMQQATQLTQGFSTTASAAMQVFSTRVMQVSTQVQSMTTATQSLTAGATALAAQLQLTATAAQTATASLLAAGQAAVQTAQRHTRAAAAAQRLGQAHRQAGTAAQRAAANTQALNETVHTLATAAVLAQGPLSGIGARITAISVLFSRGQLATGAFIAGFALVVAALVKITKESLTAALAFEKMQLGMEAATGSAEVAAEEYEFVRAAANRLGLNLESTASQYAKLLAASKGTALEGQQTRQIFLGITKASTALGLSAAETEGALRAVQQMMSKGTVQAEELRGQLGERLYGAFTLASKSMNVTTRELSGMLERGELLANEFLPKLAQVLLEAFGPGAERAATTLRASIERLKNAFFELFVEVGKYTEGPAQIFLDWVTKVVDKIKELVAPDTGIVALQKQVESLGSMPSVGGSTVDILEWFFLGRQRAIPRETIARIKKQYDDAVTELQRQIQGDQTKALMLENEMIGTPPPEPLSSRQIQNRLRGIDTVLSARLEALEQESAVRKFNLQAWLTDERTALKEELGIIERRREATEEADQARVQLAKEAGGKDKEILDNASKARSKALSDDFKARMKVSGDLVTLTRKEQEDTLRVWSKLWEERGRQQQASLEMTTALNVKLLETVKAEGEILAIQTRQWVLREMEKAQTLPTEERLALIKKLWEAEDAILATFTRRRIDRQDEELAATRDAFIELHSTREEIVTKEYSRELSLLDQLLTQGQMLEFDYWTYRTRLADKYYVDVREARAADFKDELDKKAADIRLDEAKMRRQIENLNTVNNQAETMAKLDAERLQGLAQEKGDVWGFVTATVQRSILEIGNLWQRLARLIDETLSVIRGALEGMFDKLLGGARSIDEIWRDVLRNMRQAIARFLADSVVRAFLSMFGGGGGAAGGLFGGSAGALLTLAGGLGPAGTAAGTSIGGTTGNLIAGGSALAGTAFYGLQSTRVIDYLNSAGRFGVAPTSLAGLSSIAGLGGGLISLAGVATGNQNLARGGAAVGSLGYLAGGAATPYLAGAGAALNVGLAAYNLSQGQNTESSIGTLAGTAVGAGIGTFIAPGPGTLIGAAIGGAFGGFFGGLFEREPYRQRVEGPQMEKISGLASERLSAVMGAQTPNALMAGLGGMSLGKWGGLQLTLGGRDVDQVTWDTLRQISAQPGAVGASLRVGTSGFPAGRAALESQATTILQTDLVAKIKQLDELNSQINTALADMLKAVAIPPKVSTSAEMLKRQTENFRAVLETVTGAAEAEIEHQRTILLGLTDPQEILDQTQTIRSLLEERYNGEVELVRQFVAQIEIAEDAWRSLRIAVEQQITALRLSGFGPTNPSEAVALTQMQFMESLETFRANPSAELAEQVSRLAEPYLEAASQQFARPSEDFRTIFDAVTAGLGEVAGFAKSREDELRDAIVDALGLNAQTISGAIDTSALIEQLQVEKTTELNTAIDRLRVDTADVFTAMGFQITGGLGVSAAKLAEIKAAQDAVKAAVDAAPLGTNSWLASIASYTSTIATNTTSIGYNVGIGVAAGLNEAARLADAIGHGSAQHGIERVPFNEFRAVLHKDETVLTAAEAEERRQGRSGGSIAITFGPGSIVVNGDLDDDAIQKLADAFEYRIRYGDLRQVIRASAG